MHQQRPHQVLPRCRSHSLYSYRGTSPYSYLWIFGDTTTDTGEDPTHVYDTAGTYTVTLTVTDAAAATITRTVATITVYLSVAIETVSPYDALCGPKPLNVCFEAVVEGGTAPYTYTWNFGDGAPANNTNSPCPCHGFDTCGSYPVTVTAVDALGNRGTGTANVTVFDFTVTPVADVVYGVSDLRVNFSTAFDFFCGPPFSFSCNNFEWDFGDGKVQTGCDPQHIFSEEGTYVVALKVLFECGGVKYERSGTVEINVVPDPTIIITTPEDYGEWFGQTGVVQSAVLTKSSVTRVDYYIDGYYVGSATTAPYTLMLDLCGVNGVHQLSAMAYTANGKSATSETVNIIVTNPTLDGTSFVLKNPYRVKFYGTGFKMGAKLYINGYQAPITKVLNSSTIIAKGGRALKNLMPEGVPVLITVENLDGGCTNTITFQR